MRRSNSLRALPCLAVLALCAFAPVRPATAATGTLFVQPPCEDVTAIPAQYDFENSFVGVSGCAKLCAQAVQVCRQAVKDASSCELAFSSDWIAFDSQVDCNGLTGSDLSDCKASWSADKKSWQASIKIDRSVANFGCLQHLQLCQFRCSGS